MIGMYRVSENGHLAVIFLPEVLIKFSTCKAEKNIPKARLIHVHVEPNEIKK